MESYSGNRVLITLIKYDPLIMYDSKRDVANLLNEHEHEEKHSVREFLRQQKPQAHELQSKGKYSRER